MKVELEKAYRKLSKMLLGQEDFRVLSQSEVGLLVLYLELIVRWNNKVDLVSPAPDKILVERHLIDSLAAYLLILKNLKLRPSSSIMDIGTGAGLPGVVFSVMEPSRAVYLCEPREKRCHFLREVRRELGLKKLEILCSRMEDLAKMELKDPQLTISRAIPQNSPFLSVSRETFLSQRGFQERVGVDLSSLDDHSYAVQMMGPSYEKQSDEQIINYALPESGAKRKLAVFHVKHS